MPFIGKNPTSGFSTIVKDDLTPDGSTTAFTLSKNVASANDIAVFVGNVRQEPTDAYSVSGTTLTMTAAPASGLNFYVLHIAGTTESSVIPADKTISGAKLSDNFNYDNGTLYLDSTNNRVGINQTSPTSRLEIDGTLKLKGSGEGGPQIWRDSANAGDIRFYSTNGTHASPTIKSDGGNLGQIWFQGYAGGAGDGYGSMGMIRAQVDGTPSTTSMPTRIGFHTGSGYQSIPDERMRIDSDGYVYQYNMPHDIVQGSSVSNPTISGNGSISDYFDLAYNNGTTHFNTSNGRFTAPVNGVYLFGFSLMLAPPSTNSNRVAVRVNGSDWKPNSGAQDVIQPAMQVSGTGNNQANLSDTVLIPANAGDYCICCMFSSVMSSSFIIF